MSWHYAYGKHIDEYGEEYYQVEEVYEDIPVYHKDVPVDETETLHTTGGMKPFGESQEELLSTVATMLSDLIVRGEVVDCTEQDDTDVAIYDSQYDE